jgi:hypothetical protein
LLQAPTGRECPAVTVRPPRPALPVALCGFGLRGGTLLRCWLHQEQKNGDWAHRGLLAVPGPGMTGCH